MKEQGQPKPPVRRIIERTRLLKQLEEANARTILLTAPAGYGKTTLARQWLERHEGRELALRLAESDVAVLARALARGLAWKVPALTRSVEEAIRASPTPTQQARSVLRAILDEIEEPLDMWLFIDDYHSLAEGSPAQILLDTLEASGRIRFVIASRTKPSWASARRLLYGDLVEIAQADLAFDDGEAGELLIGRNDAHRLQQDARGWPALLALAALAVEGLPGRSDLPTLYEFFAQEIYSRTPKPVQQSLLRLALLPPLSREALNAVIGSARSTDSVLATGVADEANGAVQLHPLVRDFLLAKIASRSDLAELVTESITFCLSHGAWDEAFDLIKRHDRQESLNPLVTAAYAPLVEEGRVSTLAAFSTYATVRGGLSQALLDLINAESAYRHGVFERARSLGLTAAAQLPDDHALKARSYLISGFGAQFDGRPEEALQIFNNALAVAKRPRDTRDALWGRIVTALSFEDERAVSEALEEMQALPHPNPEDRLRLIIGRQFAARVFYGLYDMERDMALAETLLASVSDPLVRTSWGNCGVMLVLQGRYTEASSILTTALVDVEKYDLEFARPHIEWSLAAAKLGLRQFARADSLLRRVEHHATASASTHLQLNIRALRARLMISQRRTTEAVAATSLEFPNARRNAMYGEYLATRALALALNETRDDAIVIAEEATSISRAVEVQVLSAAARAVALSGTRDGRAATEHLAATASKLETWDGLVCVLRASPTLLEALARSSYRAQISEVLGRSNDGALAFAAGLSVRPPRERHGILTRRERDVIDLLAQGMRTRTIALALYICDSTVKVHVRNILRKLDAHTRAEAVARYAEIIASGADSISPPPGSSAS